MAPVQALQLALLGGPSPSVHMRRGDWWGGGVQGMLKIERKEAFPTDRSDGDSGWKHRPGVRERKLTLRMMLMGHCAIESVRD